MTARLYKIVDPPEGLPFCTATISLETPIRAERVRGFQPPYRTVFVYECPSCKAVRRVAVATLIARYIWTEGSRNEATKHLAGLFFYLDWTVDDALAERWSQIRALRSQATTALEQARAEKLIGSSLQAALALPETFLPVPRGRRPCGPPAKLRRPTLLRSPDLRRACSQVPCFHVTMGPSHGSCSGAPHIIRRDQWGLFRFVAWLGPHGWRVASPTEPEPPKTQQTRG